MDGSGVSSPALRPRPKKSIVSGAGSTSQTPVSSPQLARKPVGSPSPRGEESQLSRLDKIVQELVQSERNYVTDIEILIKLYLEPLRRSNSNDEEDVSDLLTAQEVHAVFSNIDQVLGINKALLQALEKDQSLANVTAGLRDMAEYLKAYAIYCSNQDASLRTVEDAVKRIPRFKAWLKNNQTKFLSRGLDLQDFLVKPIQRICKYPLFLRELIDNGPPESAAELQDVAGRIGAVVAHINEQRRLKQGLEGVVQVFQQLASDYPLIKSQRVLLFKGSTPLKQVYMGDRKVGIESPRAVSPRAAGSPREPSATSSADSGLSSSSSSGALSFLRRVSRRASSPGSGTLSRLSASREADLSVDMPTVKEAHLFLFNDLFLFCRPCRTLGKKGLLDVYIDVASEKVRAKRSEMLNCFSLRILRDGGNNAKNKFVFQCKDSFELGEWIEAIDGVNPFRPMSNKNRHADGGNLAVPLELDSVRGKIALMERQTTLLSERLQVTQLKKQKMDADAESGERSVLEDALGKMRDMFFALPQWTYQAKELRPLGESLLLWLDVLLPHAHAVKRSVDREGSAAATSMALVSLRQHQLMLEEQKKQRADHLQPPELPTRDDGDEGEWEEVEEDWDEEGDEALDVDKLASLLKQLNPSAASPGPKAPPSGKRRKKVKVYKKKHGVVRRAQLSEARKSQSLPGSPRAVRHKSPGAPEVSPRKDEVVAPVVVVPIGRRPLPGPPAPQPPPSLIVSSDSLVSSPASAPKRPVPTPPRPAHFPPRIVGASMSMSAALPTAVVPDVASPSCAGTSPPPAPDASRARAASTVDLSGDVVALQDTVRALIVRVDELCEQYATVKRGLRTKVEALTQASVALAELSK